MLTHKYTGVLISP